MDIKDFLDIFKNNNIKNFFGVPDSLLKELSLSIDTDKYFSHMIMPSEGSAVAASIGSFIKSQTPSCVYMQNSGLGNAINPITSLTVKEVYNIPFILLVGHRGKPNTDYQDEPQHKFMGKITEDLIKILKINYIKIDNSISKEFIEKKISRAVSKKVPLCILIDKNTFIKKDTNLAKKKLVQVSNNTITRKKFFELLVSKINKKDIVVTSTGFNSRELYSQKIDKNNNNKYFYCIGGMGHTMSIASLIAHKNSNRVFCIDGDGSLLMHLGSISNIINIENKNFFHICLNNNCHESVGGQKITNTKINFHKLAKQLGYDNVIKINYMKELNKLLNNLSKLKGKIFINISIKTISENSLPRPKKKPKYYLEKLLNA